MTTSAWWNSPEYDKERAIATFAGQVDVCDLGRALAQDLEAAGKEVTVDNLKEAYQAVIELLRHQTT